MGTDQLGHKKLTVEAANVRELEDDGLQIEPFRGRVQMIMNLEYNEPKSTSKPVPINSPRAGRTYKR